MEIPFLTYNTKENLISYNTTYYTIMFATIYSKNISFLQKYFVKFTLKMTTLLNSEAYWGCLQGILIFEFHFYYKSVTQSSL